MYACALLWSRSLSNAALQSTSRILTQSLRHKWEHQNLSAVLHTVPRENQREVWGGRTNLFSVSPSSSSPPFLCWPPSSVRQTQEQTVTWLNILHSLTVLFRLIGCTSDGYVSGLAQTIWPHRIWLPLSNFVLHFSKWPILPYFTLLVYDKKESMYERKRKWVRKGREERQSVSLNIPNQ